jgi:carbamoyl-phosphate synthase small subunit
MLKPAKLALEDGTICIGTTFGAAGEVDGEVVFNTSMTGYQEILTDPSYRGQIVVMTYPEIGNYGVNAEDRESARPHLAGFVVRDPSRIASNFRSQGLLSDYLVAHGIVGLSGIDTRALVRRLRARGVMKGVLSTTDLDDASLVAKAIASPGLVGRDLVREVVPAETRVWDEGLSGLAYLTGDKDPSRPAAGRHVVALDYGMKWNIARHLHELGCRVTVLPGTATAEEVWELEPDGVFLSNGPGDPEPIAYAVETIRGLLGKVPIFGICLGHQLLALACGARTFKLKFGHRGANQPVLNLDSGRVEVTSQNHGFAVEEAGLPASLRVTRRGSRLRLPQRRENANHAPTRRGSRLRLPQRRENANYAPTRRGSRLRLPPAPRERVLRPRGSLGDFRYVLRITPRRKSRRLPLRPAKRRPKPVGEVALDFPQRRAHAYSAPTRRGSRLRLPQRRENAYYAPTRRGSRLRLPQRRENAYYAPAEVSATSATGSPAGGNHIQERGEQPFGDDGDEDPECFPAEDCGQCCGDFLGPEIPLQAAEGPQAHDRRASQEGNRGEAVGNRVAEGDVAGGGECFEDPEGVSGEGGEGIRGQHEDLGVDPLSAAAAVFGPRLTGFGQGEVAAFERMEVDAMAVSKGFQEGVVGGSPLDDFTGISRRQAG